MKNVMRLTSPRSSTRFFSRYAGTDGTQLEVRVEITATNQSGFDDSKRRIVDENAATLKFEQHGFEHD